MIINIHITWIPKPIKPFCIFIFPIYILNGKSLTYWNGKNFVTDPNALIIDNPYSNDTEKYMKILPGYSKINVINFYKQTLIIYLMMINMIFQIKFYLHFMMKIMIFVITHKLSLVKFHLKMDLKNLLS